VSVDRDADAGADFQPAVVIHKQPAEHEQHAATESEQPVAAVAVIARLDVQLSHAG